MAKIRSISDLQRFNVEQLVKNLM